MDAGPAQASRPQESPRRPRKPHTPLGSPSKSQSRDKNTSNATNSKNIPSPTNSNTGRQILNTANNKPNPTNSKNSPTESTPTQLSSTSSEPNATNSTQKTALTNATNSKNIGVTAPQKSSKSSETKPNATNSPRRATRQNWRSNSPEQMASVVQYAEDGTPDPENKVHISGFPPYTQSQDLTKIFSRFGNIHIEKFNPRLSYAVLEYDTAEEAKEAIKQTNKSASIYGKFLYVRLYTVAKVNTQSPKQEFVMTKQRGEIIDPKNIDLSGEFSDQVDRILSSVRLTQEEATGISALYADVERVLQSQWPGCVAMPFGSITTGLGIKSSDADCYVHIPAPSHRGDSASVQAMLINKAKKILQTYNRLFTEIVPIPRANTPIVKFFHLPTRTNCDLSFKTPLGAQNSRLIAFLLHADPRLIPVAVLIKYWAKVHGLSGTGRLTNYALTMMIIFYFQSPPISILPPVESLQRDKKIDIIVDSWNTGFINSQDAIPTCTNTMSILELFGGFFEFYSQFDFEKYIVCPYLGKVVEKKLFHEITDVPKEFERYIRNVIGGYAPPIRVATPVVVQDPFEQSHNVASPISSKLACEIQAYCKFAADAYNKEKERDCKNFLSTILLKRPKIAKFNPHPEFRFGIFPKITLYITDPDWKSVARRTVLQMFDQMLKIKLEKVQERTIEESKKDKEKYKGTITKPIWKRKKFTKIYNVIQMDFAEKQTRITDEIINVEKEDINLVFTLTITFANDSKNTSVMIKLIKGDVTNFNEFGKFYVNNIYLWFRTLIEPYLSSTLDDCAAKYTEYLRISSKVENTLDSDDDSSTENVDNNTTDNANEKADLEDDEKTLNKENIDEICNDNVPNAAAMTT